ncbi:GSCOCG00004348001-RA-CDS [Cotesia congregata]|nr:GSCOCG00004348001-RA-CDS [Cotesia congregata]
MDINPESSGDERIENLEKIKESKTEYQLQKFKLTNLNSSPLEPHAVSTEKGQQKFASDVSCEVDKPLSYQVMEYYHKYSQNSNLNRFFSLPGTNTEQHNHSWKAYNKILPRSRQTITTSNDNYLEAPKERRRWTRPPLIGQLSGSLGKAINDPYVERVFLEPRSSSPEIQVKPNVYLEPEINIRENSPRIEKSGILNLETDRDLKILSPASSNTSHKPLEWDSWADVGYHNVLLSTEKDSLHTVQSVEHKVSTHSLCPTSFRLDPEGTTASNVESFNGNALNSPSRTRQQSSKPNAHSTQLTDDMINSEDELKITPIIKTTYSNIIAGNITSDNEILLKSDAPSNSKEKNQEELDPKSDKSTPSDCKTSSSSKKYFSISNNKKNPIRQSLSEIDLRKLTTDDNRGLVVPFNLQSTSSFTTIVNKPTLCDKYVQINYIPENGSNKTTKETQVSLSGGIDQAGKINVEEKVKNWQTELDDKESETDKVQNEKDDKSYSENEINNLTLKSSKIKSKYDSRNENSLTKQKEPKNNNFPSQQESQREEIEGGRTSNSFEYFPGHTYKNLDHVDNTSHITSIHTDRSYSTMPNTSSSLDEKLWGHSDSLLHDLERSLTILKSLVNANKCDKQVKKRLIHHVIKRLVTAKYTDDKIECKLEDNVPWNPDNTRNKIYCNEIIQALAKKRNQQNSTEESSENSKLDKRIFSSNRKTQNREIQNKSQFINSESSDNFDERITDRTDCMQDGRKARMGLRNDKHCFYYYRHSSLKNQKDDQLFEIDKTESSDSFLPQLPNLNYQEKLTKSSNGLMRESLSSIIPIATTGPTKTPRIVPNSTSITRSSNITSGNSTVITTSTNTTTTTPVSVNSSQSNSEQQGKVQNNAGLEKKDWRLPSTMSEKLFAHEWCNSKIVSATRLIDYVEMEKKNQLVWINSEINHLSSLKKLLEESIESINKDKKDHFKEKSKRVEENLPNSSSNFKKNKQWSSHGNLVEKFKENQKILENKNSHTRHGIKDVIANKNSSDSGPTVRSPLSELSSLSSEVSRLAKNKSERYECQKQLGFSSESSSQFKQLCTDNNRPIINQSQINSKKETKNQLNDRCKSDFIVTEDEKKFNRAKYHHKGLCTSDVVVVCCNHQTDGKATDEESQERELKNEDDKMTQKNREELEKDDEKNEKVNQVVSYENFKTCHSGNQNSSSNTMYIKPIAYELSFNKKNEKTYSKTKTQSPQKTLDTSDLHNSCCSDDCHCDSTQFQLKDYLKKNNPKFVDNVEMRKRYVSEISQLRMLKKKNRMHLIPPSQPSNSTVNQKTHSSSKSSRKINDDEMKMRFRLRRLRLTDIRSKRKQQEKEDRMRRNHLMAKIFCKKLQQKVLRGQVDLSQSVSVISTL